MSKQKDHSCGPVLTEELEWSSLNADAVHLQVQDHEDASVTRTEESETKRNKRQTVADQETLTLMLDRDMYNNWCSIGTHFCLYSHSQIAEFLIHSYQSKAYLESVKACGTCGALLSWQCVHCINNQAQLDTDKRGNIQNQGQAARDVVQTGDNLNIGKARCRQRRSAAGYRVNSSRAQALSKSSDNAEVPAKKKLPFPNAWTNEEENPDDEASSVLNNSDLIKKGSVKKYDDINKGSISIGSHKGKRDKNSDSDDDDASVDEVSDESEMTDDGDNDDSDEEDDCGKDSHASDSHDSSGTEKKRTGRPFLRSSSGKYECGDCRKSYSTSQGLRRHRQKHSGDLPCCHVCGKTFSTVRNLQVHQDSIHAGLKPYVCDICSRSFGQRSNLRMHKLTHSDAKPHLCGLCGKTFKSLKQLKAHAVVHSGSKDHVCEVCAKRFNQLCNLRRHKLIHSGLKRFVCDICHKAFTQATHLKKHKFQHLLTPGQGKADVKSYVKQVMCDTCGKSFASNYIKLHKMTHTGEKPHVCEVCNKGFVQFISLKAHKLMHTGQKPYVCKVCNRAFTFSSSLSAHKRIHESQKTFVCEICSKVIKNYTNYRRHVRSHNKV